MRNGLLLFLTLLLALSLFVAGCGSDDDPADPGNGGNETTVTPVAEATIGAAGDTLAVPDTLTIGIPVLALDEDTDITVGVYDNPPTPPEGRRFVGPVYNIGPDGTAFARRTKVILSYDDGALDGASESELVMYTRSNGVWSYLPTSVNTMTDEATAYVMHLSDFALTLVDGETADGVYAVFEVSRIWYWTSEGDQIRSDGASARFDAVVNPDQAVSPLHPESVSIDAVNLTWNSSLELYLTPPGGSALSRQLRDHGDRNTSVPSLAIDTAFPNGQLSFSDEADQIRGSLEGFDIQWSGYGVDGNVVLVIRETDGPSSRLEIETDNDGAYTFTAAELADLTPGTYILSIMKSTEEAITVTGFDPASKLRTSIAAIALLELSSPTIAIGPDGGNLSLGDEGLIFINTGVFSDYHLMRCDVDSTPATAPAGWQFLTAAYAVSPADITLGSAIEIAFGWEEGDIGSFDESTVTVVSGYRNRLDGFGEHRRYRQQPGRRRGRYAGHVRGHDRDALIRPGWGAHSPDPARKRRPRSCEGSGVLSFSRLLDNWARLRTERRAVDVHAHDRQGRLFAERREEQSLPASGSRHENERQPQWDRKRDPVCSEVPTDSSCSASAF